MGFLSNDSSLIPKTHTSAFQIPDSNPTSWGERLTLTSVQRQLHHSAFHYQTEMGFLATTKVRKLSRNNEE